MYITAMVCDYRLAEEVYKAGVSFCMHKGGCSFNMLTGKSYLKSMNHCRTVWPLFMDDISMGGRSGQITNMFKKKQFSFTSNHCDMQYTKSKHP